MKNNNIFRRVEEKYLLTEEQYKILIEKCKDYIEVDTYDYSTICNIYFDTDDYLLVNRSIEKPIYKEKIRLRSYGVPKKNSKVFLEIKKKYKGIVGKRRVSILLKELYIYLENGKYPDCDKQIMDEIDYCFKLYNLKPKVFLAYDRHSYRARENKDFRLTFDQNIRSRTDELYIENGDNGNLLFENGEYIMEVKTLGSYPMWFVNLLSSLKIYPTSFSKYGNVYKKQIFKKEAWLLCLIVFLICQKLYRLEQF